MSTRPASLQSEQQRAGLRKGLVQLKAILAGTKKGTRLAGLSTFGPAILLSPEERVECESVLRGCYRQATSFEARLRIESALLRHLAATADPASAPLFEEALALRRKGSGGPERRAWAIAGLVRIAESTQDPQAQARVEALVDHNDPALALEALSALLLSRQAREGDPEEAAGSLSALMSLLAEADGAEADFDFDKATWGLIRRVATKGRFFETRWLARSYLLRADRKVPAETGSLVLEFELNDCSRTLEVSCDASLVDLTLTMLDSLGWDSDHFYEWYLSPLSQEPNFRASGGPSLFYDDDSDCLDAAAVCLGQLSMEPGHKLSLRYDFGDDHRFAVTLKEHRARPEPRAKLPRIIAKKGRAPAQYRAW